MMKEGFCFAFLFMNSLHWVVIEMNMATELLTRLGRGTFRYPDDRYVPLRIVGLQDQDNDLRDSEGEEVRAHNVHFDPKLFSTSQCQGEGDHGYDGTKYEQVDMSLTQDRCRLQGQGVEMSMLNLEKRQQVLEKAFDSLQGMVNGLGTDLGDLRDEMSGQVHSLRGEVTQRVY